MRHHRVHVYGRSILILLLMGSVTALAGCRQPRYQKKGWMVTEGDAARYLNDALAQSNPDHRRDALQQLSKTRFANHDAVVDACLEIVRKDESEHVRCAAIRLAARSERDDVTDALIDYVDARMLSSSRTSGQDGHDALMRLATRAEAGRVSDAQAGRLVGICAALLRQDESRDVRIVCAQLLGHIAARDSVGALVGSLGDADFGVVYEAERSLMRLTGVTHGHDGRQWQRWMRATQDWFAQRGALDHRLTPSEPKRWWQFGRSTPSHSFSGRAGP